MTIKKKALEHHRGMHGLFGSSDESILARSRVKGLEIHPSIATRPYDQKKKKCFRKK